jgi:DNA-binding beta-propeller fold protein YncE
VTVGADGAVWVSDFGSGALLRIDASTNRVVQRVAVGGSPNVAAFAGGFLWSTNQDGTVAPVDPTTGIVAGTRISVSTDVDAIAVSPEGVWVSTFYSGTIALIDPATRSVVRKFDLPGQASGLAFTGGALWASEYNRARVVELDPATGKVTRTVAVGAKPRDLAFDGTSLWVVSEGANTISKLGG